MQALATTALADLAPAARDARIMALCDQAITELGEARTLDEVLGIKNAAEAFDVYARKLRASHEASARCTQITLLAETRIGTELKAAQARDEIGAQGRRSDIVRDADEVKPTIADLGISRQRAAEYKALAEAGPEVIKAEVQAATEEGRRPSRKRILDQHREMKRAVEKAVLGEVELPSPTEAKRQATESGSLVLGSDYKMHPPQDAAIRQKAIDVDSFHNPLRELAQITITPDRAFEAMSPTDRKVIPRRLVSALTWLNKLQEIIHAS